MSLATRTTRLLFAILLAVAAAVFLRPAGSQNAPERKLVLVYVIDGLRPDSVTAQDTPNLYRLKHEGVEYVHAHAAFPTVTRVNSAVISTGTYPQKNGLVGNAMYVPEVDPARPFNTQDHRLLLKMKQASGGKLLFVPTLADRLSGAGLLFVAIGSGSPGGTFLLNPAAVEGKGVAINSQMAREGAVAYPERVASEVAAQFGKPPDGAGEALVDWTERVLRDYVLEKLKPAVVINWHTQPDSAQHRFGAGSPEALKALRSADAHVGRAIEKLKALGLAGRANILVVSDHGFARHSHEVSVAQALIDAGLKASRDSDDLVIASNGQSLSLHVKERDPYRTRQVCEFLQQQDWAEAIFTPAMPPRGLAPGGRSLGRPEQGWIAGTFALELARMANRERGPDIVVTLPWSSDANAAGVIGAHYTAGSGNRALTGGASGHGGLSPAVVRNTLIAWGPDFRERAVIRVPGGNVDVAPTILALLGLPAGAQAGFDGRVLAEALRKGTDPEKVALETYVITTDNGKGYRAVLQISKVEEHAYVDKAWRLR